jgi:hypothetical protein
MNALWIALKESDGSVAWSAEQRPDALATRDRLTLHPPHTGAFVLAAARIVIDRHRSRLAKAERLLARSASISLLQP